MMAVLFYAAKEKVQIVTIIHMDGIIRTHCPDYIRGSCGPRWRRSS